MIPEKYHELLAQMTRFALTGGLLTVLVAAGYWIVATPLGVEPMLALTLTELLDYTDEERAKWRQWFAAHPGTLDLRLQPVAFPGLIEELFVTVRPLADKFGSKLSLDTSGNVTIVSDPRRVRQILLNLLSNAIKFGGGKPIRVQCQRAPDDGVTIAVTDQGDGIPPEDQERIFQEFVQLGKTQLQEGTGLGLPISRRLAELLHGSLTLESEKGKGSTFRLTLPARATETPPSRVSDQEMPQRAVDERHHKGAAAVPSDAAAAP